MHIELDNLSPKEVYFNLIQTLIPRPIAWVLSENAGGSYNLAPFSYFTAVCSKPPLILISVGKKPDGTRKDSWVNIEERRDFVVHIAHLEILEALNASSVTLPAEASEVEQLGLPVTPFPGSRLPRLQEARVAYGCECYEIQEIGSGPQALIFGRVHTLYVDDAICSSKEGRLKVHGDQLNPIGRLGANEYMKFGEIITLNRPK
ncbi:flavin reductase domain protein FMN-binding protein [Nitrosococcus halophilus Nc 4]|uniref:Flavin reductase domain protein FMN-binding protein n=1 Tax=Nitrosococcus halophilus (strain Nc4) TaxID=472759 RepID=D5C174_NITHN|nr:flavin reductase family protein [Nitrosococcus halophilus]ADE14631.1 flavin reductase domain protein FMN-binding protein [Nitrosococcus halophilus Nc 4]